VFQFKTKLFDFLSNVSKINITLRIFSNKLNLFLNRTHGTASFLAARHSILYNLDKLKPYLIVQNSKNPHTVPAVKKQGGKQK